MKFGPSVGAHAQADKQGPVRVPHKHEARHWAGLRLLLELASDQFWTFSSVRRLVSFLQPGKVCGVCTSGRLSP